MIEVLQGLQAGALSLYSAWPHPWIALVACTVGMVFGFSLVQFAKSFRRACGYRKLSTDEMRLYSGAIAFVVGAFVAREFPAVQTSLSLLLLHAMAAGLLCPWLAQVYITKLKKLDAETFAAALAAFDGDVTIEKRKSDRRHNTSPGRPP